MNHSAFGRRGAWSVTQRLNGAWRIVAIAVATMAGLTLPLVGFSIVSPPASASSSGVAPDVGLYCYEVGRLHSTVVVTYMFTGQSVTYAHPICHYAISSEGEYEEGLGGYVPAFAFPGSIAGDWGSSCRTGYGKQSHAYRTTSGAVVCQNASFSYYIWAQKNYQDAPVIP